VFPRQVEHHIFISFASSCCQVYLVNWSNLCALPMREAQHFNCSIISMFLRAAELFQSQVGPSKAEFSVSHTRAEVMDGTSR